MPPKHTNQPKHTRPTNHTAPTTPKTPHNTTTSRTSTTKRTTQRVTTTAAPTRATSITTPTTTPTTTPNIAPTTAPAPAPAPSKTPGHVFVVHGDLRAICCDATILPVNTTTCTHFRKVEGESHVLWDFWFDEHKTHKTFEQFINDQDNKQIQFTDGVHMMTSYPPFLPLPILVDGSPVGGADTIIQIVRSALKQAVDFFETNQISPGINREKHLLALPTIGGWTPSIEARLGDFLASQLLPALRESVVEFGVDVVLVVWEEAIFRLCQALRTHAQIQDSFTALTPEHMTKARQLASLANSSQLAVFVGAGASVGAGLPTWDRLLTSIGEAIDPPLDITNSEFAAMDYLTKADVLIRRCGSREKMLQILCSVIESRPLPSLSHTLLASLPVREFITTNYDALLEKALQSGQGINKKLCELSVLPHSPNPSANKWLLKMHGTIDDPSTIVFSREDYIRYSDRRSALAGIVQAKLITSHMLFIGFSLSDDNLHRIIDTVRKSVGLGNKTPDEIPRCINLSILPQPLKESLWKDEVEFISFASLTEQFNVGRRRHEVFLDLVCALATGTNLPILDPRFGNILNAGQRELCQVFRGVVQSVSAEARNTDEFVAFLTLLEKFGLDTATTHVDEQRLLIGNARQKAGYGSES